MGGVLGGREGEWTEKGRETKRENGQGREGEEDEKKNEKERVRGEEKEKKETLEGGREREGGRNISK